MMYFYLRSVSHTWPMAARRPSCCWGTLNTIVLLASLVPNQLAKRAARARRTSRGVRIWLVRLPAVRARVPRSSACFEFAALNVRWDSERLRLDRLAAARPAHDAPDHRHRRHRRARRADVHRAARRQALRRRQRERALLVFRRVELAADLRGDLLGAALLTCRVDANLACTDRCARARCSRAWASTTRSSRRWRALLAASVAPLNGVSVAASSVCVVATVAAWRAGADARRRLPPIAPRGPRARVRRVGGDGRRRVVGLVRSRDIDTAMAALAVLIRERSSSPRSAGRCGTSARALRRRSRRAALRLELRAVGGRLLVLSAALYASGTCVCERAAVGRARYAPCICAAFAPAGSRSSSRSTRRSTRSRPRSFPRTWCSMKLLMSSRRPCS